jgi:transcription elongation factor Elf1
MSDLFTCPWGCGEMIEVDEASVTANVTCPRCGRNCRLKKHEEPDGTSWFELTPHEP